MIAILCPTRGRPEQFKRMVESSIKTAAIKQNVIHSTFMSESDAKTYPILDAVQNVKNILSICPDEICNAMSTVEKWNGMAERFLADKEIKLFMLGADDMIFSTPGWDKALLDHYNALENKIHVYVLQDSRDPDGTPHPIFTREWIEFFGYMISPIFLHWEVDTWSCEIARYNECFTHLREFELIHLKPSDQGQPDETHLSIRRRGWRERDSYVRNKCEHYLEFDKKRLKEHLTNQFHQNYLKTMPAELT